jgi:hypothetical protein
MCCAPFQLPESKIQRDFLAWAERFAPILAGAWWPAPGPRERTQVSICRRGLFAARFSPGTPQVEASEVEPLILARVSL